MVKYLEVLEQQNDTSMLNVKKYEQDERFEAANGKRKREEDDSEDEELEQETSLGNKKKLNK